MRPCIVVAGMGRCGTSLMMQMLDAAGVPCVGEWPAYETDASAIQSFDPDSFAAMTGRAIKLVDPMNLSIGAMPNHVVLWLDRDFDEQAKSLIKFISLSSSIPNDRATRRAVAGSLRRDRQVNRRILGVEDGSIASLAVRFEGLINRPDSAVVSICTFLARHGWQGMESGPMVAQVRSRAATCLPGFLEASFIEDPRRRA